MNEADENSCVFGSKKVKIEAMEVDWRRFLSSMMLQLWELRNFHCWSSLQQSKSSMLWPRIQWNSSSMMMIECRSKKNEPNWWRFLEEMMKNVEKSFENFERIWREKQLDPWRMKCHYDILLWLVIYTISLIHLLIQISKTKVN